MVYTVTAWRYASFENHSYLVGVFTSPDKAIYAADSEEDFRGGKYSCEILGWNLDVDRIHQEPEVIRELTGRKYD